MQLSRTACTILTTLWIALSWAAATAKAQDPEPSDQAYGEVVSVYVVDIDVRVTDRDGNPVSGLSAADFTLREDGDEVEITNFSEVPARPKPERPDESEEPTLDESVPSALIVFVVDDTAIEPRNRKRAIEQIGAAIDRGFDPYTAATIAVIDGGLRILGQPTGDATQLRAALAQLGDAPPSGITRQRERDAELREVLIDVGETMSQFRSQVIESNDAVRELNALTRRVQTEVGRRRAENLDSFAAMGGLIEALARMPGRKAIVYTSQGLAMRPGQAALEVIREALAEISARGDGEAFSASVDARSAMLTALDDQIRAQKRRPSRGNAPPQDLIAVSALAAKAGVSFYAWKAQGNLGVASAEFGPEAGLALTTSVRDARERSLTETLNVLADETGGRVAIGAGFEELVERAIADFGGYYSLGFSPTHGGDNQLHKLKLKVRGRGLDVWYPRSYVALPPAGSR